MIRYRRRRDNLPAFIAGLMLLGLLALGSATQSDSDPAQWGSQLALDGDDEDNAA